MHRVERRKALRQRAVLHELARGEETSQGRGESDRGLGQVFDHSGWTAAVSAIAVILGIAALLTLLLRTPSVTNGERVSG